MKTKITQQQMDNLRDAAENMWPSVPPENVYPALMDFTMGSTSRTDCGTVACGGGWVARWPAFQRQGVRLDRYGAPRLRGERSYPAIVAMRLFGEKACGLFRARWWDETGTDHEVFAKRLQHLIENSEVVS